MRPSKSTSRKCPSGKRRAEVSAALATLRREGVSTLRWRDKVLTLTQFQYQDGSFRALVRIGVGITLVLIADKGSHYVTMHTPFMVVNPRRILAVVSAQEAPRVGEVAHARVPEAAHQQEHPERAPRRL